MIRFEQVSKVYSNGVKGLDNVTLDIEQGEFVAIIGLSGAGKSTLLRSINRMHGITGGKLTVDGVDVTALKGKELRRFRRKIGMIFQSFNLITRTTVINNVLTSRVPDLPWWRSLLGIYRREDKIAALEALDKVGILDKAYSRVDQLSGGQQQRVAIARALATKPAILLCDEPTGNLDTKTSQDVLSLLKVTGEKFSQTIVMITHNEEIAQLADRIVRIEDGKIKGGEQDA